MQEKQLAYAASLINTCVEYKH